MTTSDELTREVDRLRESDSRPSSFHQTRSISWTEQIEQVEETLDAQPDKPRRSLRELEGLGQELWRSIDVEAYLERERILGVS